jgi:hypothetical protein
MGRNHTPLQNFEIHLPCFAEVLFVLNSQRQEEEAWFYFEREKKCLE